MEPLVAKTTCTKVMTKIFGHQGKGIMITLPMEMSVRSKENLSNLPATTKKLYFLKDVKDLNMLKHQEMYEEVVANFFWVRDVNL